MDRQTAAASPRAGISANPEQLLQRFGFLCVGRVVSHASGDRRAYTDQARAQRNKDFEEITVTFDEPPEQ